MTRCSLPCRPMRWYDPTHGSPLPPVSSFGSSTPPSACWDLFGVWEIHGFCLSLFAFTGTSLVALLLLPSFPPRWTNTFGDWTQTWPALKLI